MKKGRLWMLGWVLLGLLFVAGGLLYLGKREGVAQPSAESYNPSGSRALAELLRRSGFEVKVDRTSKPKLEKSDLAVAFLVPASGFFGGTRPDDPEDPLRMTLREHLESGGRTVFLHVPREFGQASQLAYSSRHAVYLSGRMSDDPDFEISAGANLDEFYSYDAFVMDEPGLSLATNEDEAELIRLTNLQDGIIASVNDATSFTNRFLDQEENAAFAVWLFRTFTPETGRIVILEAMHAPPIDPGLLGMFGPWAVAGWWQAVFLFLVLAYTLGRRFGLPEKERTSQRGGRELVDAYADVLARAKMARVALKTIVQSADREVRKRFGIAVDLPPKRRNELIDAELAESLSRAEVASQAHLLDTAALKLAQDLENRLAKVKGEPLRRRKKRR